MNGTHEQREVEIIPLDKLAWIDLIPGLFLHSIPVSWSEQPSQFSPAYCFSLVSVSAMTLNPAVEHHRSTQRGYTHMHIDGHYIYVAMLYTHDYSNTL